MHQEENTPPFHIDLEGPCDGVDPRLTLEEFVRQQLAGLLDIVVLTSNGAPVDVDGFRWSKDAFCRTTDELTKPIPIIRPPGVVSAADDQ